VRNKFRAAVWRIWHDWWVEIVIGLLVALAAVFAGRGAMSIRQALRAWLVALLGRASSFFPGVARAVGPGCSTPRFPTCWPMLLLGRDSDPVAHPPQLMTLPLHHESGAPAAAVRCIGVHRRGTKSLLDLYDAGGRRYQCTDPTVAGRGRLKRSRLRLDRAVTLEARAHCQEPWIWLRSRVLPQA